MTKTRIKPERIKAINQKLTAINQIVKRLKTGSQDVESDIFALERNIKRLGEISKIPQADFSEVKKKRKKTTSTGFTFY